MIRPNMAKGSSGKWTCSPTEPKMHEWTCVPMPSGWREGPRHGTTLPNSSSPTPKTGFFFSTRSSYSQDSWSHIHICNSLLRVLCPHLHGIQVSSPFKHYPSQTNTAWPDLNTRNLKKLNSKKQRVEWWLPGAVGRGNGEILVKGHKPSAVWVE